MVPSERKALGKLKRRGDLRTYLDDISEARPVSSLSSIPNSQRTHVERAARTAAALAAAGCWWVFFWRWIKRASAVGSEGGRPLCLNKSHNRSRPHLLSSLALSLPPAGQHQGRGALVLHRLAQRRVVRSRAACLRGKIPSAALLPCGTGAPLMSS